jgi:hypothetical protein
MIDDSKDSLLVVTCNYVYVGSQRPMQMDGLIDSVLDTNESRTLKEEDEVDGAILLFSFFFFCFDFSSIVDGWTERNTDVRKTLLTAFCLSVCLIRSDRSV